MARFDPPSEPSATGLGVSLPLLIISLALLVGVGVTCLFTWAEYIKAADQTRRSVAIVGELQSTVSDLEAAEAAQQGYLLTRDEQYRSLYRKTIPAVDRRIGQLFALEAQSGHRTPPVEDQQFAQAIQAKRDDLVATEALIAQGDLPGAVQRVRRGAALQRLQRARQLAAEEQAREQGRLAAQRSRSRYFARLSELIATFGSAGIFVIVLLSTVRIRRLIRARDALTRELRRSNEDLQQFAYSASHDLQEPLRNLMIYSDLLERRIAEGALETLRREVRLIHLSANRMRALIADLLIYTKVVSAEPETPELTDLNLVLRRVLENLEPALAEAEAQVDADGLPRVRISALHAEQLLQNLLSNALKYRRPGVPAAVAVSAARNRSHWIISVRDNGIGIDPRYQAQIFGIFKRLHTATEYPGTGLGLAICRKIVERHKGRIWVDSQVDQGSTFHFSIPGAN
jgi:signal transduction histidine kinase